MPDGTGKLTARLQSQDPDTRFDVAFGLLEGFIADLGKFKSAENTSRYSLAGTYVQSPLRWAISTGARRDDISSLDDLRGTRVGVSRIGSGSYVMSFVLADEHGWLREGQNPFEVIVLGHFKELRDGVNNDEADFFMWDHTTSQKYWDNGELKRIGEIYTQWPSWAIAMGNHVSPDDQTELFAKVNEGVQYLQDNPEDAIRHITGTMHYSDKDAQEWMKAVQFSDDVTGVDPAVVDKTAELLRKTGVLKWNSGGSDHMISILRGA